MSERRSSLQEQQLDMLSPADACAQPQYRDYTNECSVCDNNRLGTGLEAGVCTLQNSQANASRTSGSHCHAVVVRPLKKLRQPALLRL